MARFQKILLLVLIVPLTLFPGGVIIYALLYEQPRLDIITLIPLGLSLLGICSFIFHFKTVKFYRLLKKKAHLPTVEPMLWILDIVFGIAYIAISCYLLYLIFLIQSRHPLTILVVFIIPMLLIGLWTVIEAVYLHKMIQIHKRSHRHSEIEDIKGESTE